MSQNLVRFFRLLKFSFFALFFFYIAAGIYGNVTENKEIKEIAFKCLMWAFYVFLTIAALRLIGIICSKPEESSKDGDLPQENEQDDHDGSYRSQVSALTQPKREKKASA